MQDLLTTLYNTASAQVKMRNAYTSIGRVYGSQNKYFTYALLLKRGCVYVGSTDNIYTRLADHTMMNKSASLWVRENGPIERILEITYDAPECAETERTLDYMSMFGFEKVRGASWCRASLRSPPADLLEFKRGQVQHHFMTREEIEQIRDHVHQLIESMKSE
jgi:predicted GIY-YIG superfamily endonuclease